MWCYQKPGFEALLLAELQRQQQRSQFCDTLLKAGGVSVPAHSCILSAISPHISSALSSSPPPPSGQSRLLEFQALGACTLLHIIRLLYSGEMAGEGENEKQEAIYAAAKLGISGLVEVTKSRGRLGGGMEQRTEVGVQTEPMTTEEDEVRPVRWRREMGDGFTYLWKEALSDGGRDMWTQTEEQLANSSAPVPSVVLYETIDMSVLQSLGQTDSHQFVPVTLVYPPDENQTLQYSCGPPDCLQESITSGSTSVAVVTPKYAPVPAPLPYFPTWTASCVAESQSCWVDPNANPEEWEGERLEQFEGNIAGFISHFLDPEKRESNRRGRAGRRPRAARAARTGQQRTRRPRGRARGRGRGTVTQTVDVQEIGVGKLQKLFLHRWRVSTPRTGQGGGAVGGKLCQKTREELEPARKAQRTRRRGKVFEVDQSQNVQQGSNGGAANIQRGPRKTTQQVTKATLSVGRGQICTNQAAPDYYSIPSRNFYSGPSLTSSTPSLQPELSHAALYVSPASSLLHSSQFAPAAPPPQPEHIDRLLEEVIMDLNISPNNKPSLSQCPLPTSGDTSGHSAIQNKQQAQISSSEVPVLQQQCEGEQNDILENFLQSFEQHVESRDTRKESETLDESSSEASQPDAVLRKHKTPEMNGETPPTPALQRLVNHSQTPGVQSDHTGSDNQAVSTENSDHTSWEKSITPARRPKKRRANTYLFSLERKRVRKMASDANATPGQGQREQQLQQTPVVKLQRNSFLSFRATLQGNNCQSPEEKSPSEAKESSMKFPCYGDFRKNWVTKSYPIRSRCTKPQLQDFLPFLEKNLVQESKPPGQKHGRPRKNGNLLSSCPVESTTSVQPQSTSSCCTNNQMEKNPGQYEEDLTVQLQEEVRGIKRGAESIKGTVDEVLVDKRICFDQTTTSEPFTPSSQSTDIPSAAATLEQVEVIDVETVSVSSLTDCLQEAKQEEEPISEAEESLSSKDAESPDEIIDVEEDQEDSAETIWHKEDHSLKDRRSVPPSHPDKGFTLEWMGKYEKNTEDEDIDVIGGTGPAPDPVIISWTESSEEEVDVVEEKMDDTSCSVILPAGS